MVDTLVLEASASGVRVQVPSSAPQSIQNQLILHFITMPKAGIHPKLVTSTVSCSCGATFETLSTLPEIRVETCNNCHPFYTGENRLLKTGAVDKFYARQKKVEAMKK